MNIRKVLPVAVAALMLVSVLGVVFLPVSDADDDPVVVTDNLLNVGDAIGIGGAISFDDLVRIFALDGGEDYELSDEIIWNLISEILSEEDEEDEEGPGLFDPKDLNGDGEIDTDEYIVHIQHLVFSVLKVLEEKLGLDLSASVSIYGMAEVIEKKGNDYVLKVDAAAQMEVSVGISLKSRPVEGTYYEDSLDDLLPFLLLSLFPDDVPEDLEDFISEEYGGFMPEFFEEESIWVNLNAVLAASLSGYLYMTKDAESPDFTINGVLLDIKAGADLNVSTNAKIGITTSYGDLAIMLSYPDEIQTIGIRATVAASMETVFSATSVDSVLPEMGVYTEDGKTTLRFSDGTCLNYLHFDASVCAELYGNGKDMLAPVMGLIGPDMNTGSSIVTGGFETTFSDYTGSEYKPDVEIGIWKNKLDILGTCIEYDEGTGRYTISFSEGEDEGEDEGESGFGFTSADKDAPSLFSMLGIDSIVLDGQRKSSIMGSVNSIRNNIPDLQRPTSKIIFLNDNDVKLRTITVTNGEKIPKDAFPELNMEGYEVVGWVTLNGGTLYDLITEDTVITHDLILYPLLLEVVTDADDFLEYYWRYQKVQDVDYAFESGDEMKGGDLGMRISTRAMPLIPGGISTLIGMKAPGVPKVSS